MKKKRAAAGERGPGVSGAGAGSSIRRSPRDTGPRDRVTLLRRLPQVEKLLQHPRLAALADDHSRPVVAQAVRDCLADLRCEILEAERGEGGGRASLLDRLEPEALATEVSGRLVRTERPAYRRAINATGIILHTGLGRAVYPAEAQQAIAAATAGYSVVEIDADTGERNRREVHVARLLEELTGAESATVVNNNAGATLIILAALARGKEVLLSRGQMVEIGGAFRIPDVMEESGARLVGVGTTNRTYIEDYRRALGPDTGLLLQVHTSNYEIVGFARHTPLEELVALGKERGLPVVSDLGSGCMVDVSQFGLKREPLVSDSVKAGADLVCFSGDKLLGGPQAGIIVGKRDQIEKVRRHPLFRALRVDKVALAGLEATLRLYRDPARAFEKVPSLRMLVAPEGEVRKRAARFAKRLKSARPEAAAAVVATKAETGSGSLPAQEIASWAVAVEATGLAPDVVAAELRRREPPVFARIHEGRVLLDFRTVLPDDERSLLEALVRVLSA